jgi:predicted transposase/invertase (TIGR01784 family)
MDMTYPIAKYINPYTDFGFKKLFGTEANRDLLTDFLNELIRDKGKIVDVSFLNPEQLGRNPLDRKSVYDVYCTTDREERFIVEMQRAKQDYFKDRSVFYSTFPIQAQAPAGDWNYRLNAVYFVGILDFVFEENRDDANYYHHEVKLMDTAKKTVFYDKLTYIYLEMPKFNKREDELETHFDKWLYVIKRLPHLQERPVALQERVFRRLFDVAEIYALPPEEQVDYDQSLKVMRDSYSVEETKKAEGMKIGLKKGEQTGRREQKMEIARNSLAAGLSVETVVQITGLTAKQVEALKD